MYTRKDFLFGNVTFEQYYGQFITSATKLLVIHYIGLDRITQALEIGDIHLNTIPLIEWDNLTHKFSCKSLMEHVGDYPTLMGKVCILKETARILAQTKNVNHPTP